MPDEVRDGRNVALKFLSDCWHAQLSKTEFLYGYYDVGGWTDGRTDMDVHSEGCTLVLRYFLQ